MKLLIHSKTSTAVEVWEWISDFIPHLIMDVVFYPCKDETQSTLLGFIAYTADTICIAVLCFVVVMLSVPCGVVWSIFPYPSWPLHWHRGNHAIAPVPVKWPWRIWVNRLLYPTATKNNTNLVYNYWYILKRIIETCINMAYRLQTFKKVFLTKTVVFLTHLGLKKC